MQCLATPDGVSYTNVLHHNVLVSNVYLQLMRIGMWFPVAVW